MSKNTSVEVVVRVRPLSDREKRNGKLICSIDDQKKRLTVTDTPQGQRQYSFDSVLGPETTNNEAYENVCENVVKSALNGINSTIFAYGQTSSGKTYTMYGPDDGSMTGVIPRAVDTIFSLIDSKPINFKYKIKCFFIEIYNEKMIDLLNQRNSPIIRQHLERGVYVENVEQVHCRSVSDCMNVIQRGLTTRTSHATKSNARSSRSHAIFQMQIQCRETVSDGEEQFEVNRTSVLNLVDLAGSERIAKTKSQGQRRKEGGHINRSLLFLGNVISDLAKMEETGQNVPITYRNSKLTRILQNSLGGNARTLVFCCVAGANHHMEETLSTLMFASKARKITNTVEVKERISDRDLVKKYRYEISQLKERVAQRESELETNQGRLDSMQSQNDDLLETLSELKARVELIEARKERGAPVDGFTEITTPLMGRTPHTPIRSVRTKSHVTPLLVSVRKSVRKATPISKQEQSELEHYLEEREAHIIMLEESLSAREHDIATLEERIILSKKLNSTELDRKQENIDDLQQQNDELSEYISQLTNEIGEKSNLIEHLEEKLDEQVEHVQNLTNDVGLLEIQKDEFQEDAINYQKEQSRLESIIKEKNSELDQQEAFIEERNLRIEALEAVKTSSTKGMRVLQSQLEDSNNRNTMLEGVITELSSTVMQWCGDLRKEQNAIRDTVLDNNDTYSSMLDEISVRYGEQITAATEAEVDHENVVSELLSEIESVKDSRDAYMQECAAYKVDISRTNTELSELTESMEQQSKTITSLESLVTDGETSNTALENRIIDMEKHHMNYIEGLRSELEFCPELELDPADDIEGLEDLVSNAVEQVREELEEALDFKKSLSMDLSTLNEKHEELKGDHTVYKNDNDNYKKDNDKLEKILKSTRTELKELTIQFESQQNMLQGEASELQSVYTQLQLDHKCLQTGHKNLQKEYSRLTEDVEKLNVDHTKLLTDLSGLQSEHEHVKVLNSELNLKVQNLTLEISESQRECSFAYENMERYKSESEHMKDMYDCVLKENSKMLNEYEYGRDLEKDYEERLAEKDDDMKEFKETTAVERKQAEKRISDLKQDIINAKAEHDILISNIEKEFNETVSAMGEEHRARVEELQSTVASVQIVRKELEESITQLNEEKEDIESDFDLKTIALRDSTEKLGQLQDEIESLKSEIDELKSSHQEQLNSIKSSHKSQLESALSNSDNETQKLIETINTQNSQEIKRLNSKLEQRSLDIEAIKEQHIFALAGLDAQNVELQQTITESSLEHQRLSYQIAELTDLQERSLSNCEKLQNLLESKSEESIVLSNANSVLETTLADQTEVMAKLRMDLQTLTDNHSTVCDTLQKEREEMESERLSVESEITRLIEEISTSKSTEEQLKKELTSKCADLSAVKSKSDKLEQKIEDITLQYSTLEKQQQDTEEKLVASNEKVESMTQKLKNFKQRLHDAESSNTIQNDTHNNIVAVMQEDFERQAVVIDEMKTDLESWKEKSEMQSEMMDSLKEKLENVHAQSRRSNSECDVLKEAVIEKEKELKELTILQERTHVEKTMLDTQLLSFIKECDATTAALNEQLSVMKSELTEKDEILKTTIDNSAQELIDVKEELTAAKDEIKEAKRTYNELMGRYRDSEETVSEMSDELSRQRVTERGLEAKIEEQKESILSLEIVENELSEIIDSHKSQMKQVKQIIAEKDTLLATLADEGETGKALHEQAQRGYAQKLKEIEAVVTQLRLGKEELENRCVRLETELNTVRVQNEGIKLQMENIQGQSAEEQNNLTKRIDDAEKQNSVLTGFINKLEKDVSTVTHAMNHYKSKLSKIKVLKGNMDKATEMLCTISMDIMRQNKALSERFGLEFNAVSMRSLQQLIDCCLNLVGCDPSESKVVDSIKNTPIVSSQVNRTFSIEKKNVQDVSKKLVLDSPNNAGLPGNRTSSHASVQSSTEMKAKLQASNSVLETGLTNSIRTQPKKKIRGSLLSQFTL
ncbi:hypothetical protein PCE1_000001 [Barthelona sp. PCE]